MIISERAQRAYLVDKRPGPRTISPSRPLAGGAYCRVALNDSLRGIRGECPWVQWLTYVARPHEARRKPPLILATKPGWDFASRMDAWLCLAIGREMRSS